MLRIIKPGLQTSIQDSGRPGWMRYGVPGGGAADPVAMSLANVLLENPAAQPCLEIALTGPEIEFDTDLSIAVCGARFALTLNGEEISNDRVIRVNRHDRLQFGALQYGARAYLALAATIDLPSVMGSLSTHLQTCFGGFAGRALKSGDEIPLIAPRTCAPRQLPEHLRLRYTARPQLRVTEGAEAGLFDEREYDRFYTSAFIVSAQSNRMGLRLEGASLNTDGMAQIISSGLCPGTVQVPPNGQPIISFVEGQTIGGYPRLAHVISADQHLLGQLKPRDKVNFLRVSLERSQRILREKTALLAELPW